jgi:hypothetical protein
MLKRTIRCLAFKNANHFRQLREIFADVVFDRISIAKHIDRPSATDSDDPPVGFRVDHKSRQELKVMFSSTEKIV